MATKMTRLTAPNGATVSVSAEKAERLIASEGYKAVEDTRKAPAKKAAASSKSDSND